MNVELLVGDKYLQGTVEYTYTWPVIGNYQGTYENCYPDEPEEYNIEKLYLVVDSTEVDMSVLLPEVHECLIEQIKEESSDGL